MNRKRTLWLCKLFITFIILCVGYHNRYAIINCFNTGYKARLYAPTMLYKSNNYYYITDCLHGRIIYCDSLDSDLTHWWTLNDKVTGTHSIASDDRFVIFDDTEGSRLFVYEEREGKVLLNKILETPECRPHYIHYDPDSRRFYALCSTGGIIMTLIAKDNTVFVERMDTLNFLSDHYVRSFNIIDNNMYFVSGRNQRPPKIYQVDYKRGYCIKDSFLVPNELSNTNYIAKVGNYYYITSLSDSTADELNPNIVKVQNLGDLTRVGGYRLYDSLNFMRGAPYYITHVNGHVYVAFISDVNGIKELTFCGDSIVANRDVFLFDHITLSSKLRERYIYPKSVIEHKSRKNFFANRKRKNREYD